MKHYYCKSSHTFSFKQSNLEAMTNVKLTYSSRLLKKGTKVYGPNSSTSETHRSPVSWMHSEASAGRGTGPERAQFLNYGFCAIWYFYPPHKSQSRKYNFLLKQPGSSASATGIFRGPPLQPPAGVPVPGPCAGAQPSASARPSGKPTALRGCHNAHLRVSTLPVCCFSPAWLLFFFFDQRRRKKPAESYELR